jgi:hypothetical protein
MLTTPKTDFNIIPNTTDDIKRELAAYGENIDGLKNYVTAVNYSKSALQLRFCGVFRAMQDPNYLKKFGNYDNFKAFLEENADYFDVTVSTASEMAKYWRVFKEAIDKNEYVKKYFDTVNPTYTEGIELCKVSKQKGKSAEDTEILNDIESFLREYAPNNVKSWNTMAELRNIIKLYKGAVTVNRNDGDETPETPKPSGNANTVISVDDISAKNAATIVKSLKENGDVVENKAKKTCIVEADNLEEFMNRVVALAKQHKVKPMELIGKITMTIDWTATEGE